MGPLPCTLESDGPYFEIMEQLPGPTINLKACESTLVKMSHYWKSHVAAQL